MGDQNVSMALNAQAITDLAPTGAAKKLRLEIYQVLKQANFDYERMQYNTVVSAMMKMLNLLEDAKAHAFAESEQVVFAECMSIMLRIMNPVCPHISEFIWSELGFAKVHGAILDGVWPEVHEGALVKESLELMLQVNGKLRGSLVVPVSASSAEIEALALAHEATVRLLAGAQPKKVIVVSGRLVNVVI